MLMRRHVQHVGELHDDGLLLRGMARNKAAEAKMGMCVARRDGPAEDARGFGPKVGDEKRDAFATRTRLVGSKRDQLGSDVCKPVV